MPESQTLERPKTKIQPPRMFKVVIHNDDYTPIEFVVAVLIEYFSKTPDQAMELATMVHTSGKGIAGQYRKEIADQKVSEVTSEARAYGFPLKLTAEPI